MNILGHNFLGGHNFKLMNDRIKGLPYQYYKCNYCKYEVLKDNMIDLVVSEKIISCNEMIIKNIIE